MLVLEQGSGCGQEILIMDDISRMCGRESLPSAQAGGNEDVWKVPPQTEQCT